MEVAGTDIVDSRLTERRSADGDVEAGWLHCRVRGRFILPEEGLGRGAVDTAHESGTGIRQHHIALDTGDGAPDGEFIVTVEQ